MTIIQTQTPDTVPGDGRYYALVGLNGANPTILAGTGTDPYEAIASAEQWVLATFGGAVGMHGARIQVLNRPPVREVQGTVDLPALLREAQRRLGAMQADAFRDGDDGQHYAMIGGAALLTELLLRILSEEGPTGRRWGVSDAR